MPALAAAQRLAVTAVLLAGLAACRSTPPPEADVILRGGIVRTPAGEGATATPPAALAIRAGRILAVGPEPAVLRHKGPGTRIVDLEGAAVVPGFGDAHARPFEAGERSLNEASGGALYLDLSQAESEEDVVQRVRARARTLGPGEWVLGAGWDESRWVAAKPPDRRLLSDIVGANPVLLARAGGGTIWVNNRALDLAGIDRGTPDPAGGRILRERQGGEPTGILLGRACDPVLRRATRLAPEERATAILAGLKDAPAHGLTMVAAVATGGRLGVDDPSAPALEVLGPWRDLAGKGRLPARVSVLVAAPSAAAEDLVAGGPERNLGDGRLDIDTILLEAPETADLGGWTRRSAARGLGVAILAHGPEGVRAAIAAFGEARSTPGGPAPRLSLEVSGRLDSGDLGILAAAGVVLTVRAVDGADLEGWPPAGAGGARIDLAAAGSGALLDPPATFDSFAARLSRVTDGAGADGNMARLAALRLFTLGPARAAGRMGEIGCLEPGCRADLVILSRDPIAALATGAGRAPRVLATWLDGREIYRMEGAAP